MDVNRRNIIGLLVACPVITRVVEAQAPPATSGATDADLQAARQRMQRYAQRIAMVKLPPTTEPAVQFRA
jgi:hypothetical protein